MYREHNTDNNKNQLAIFFGCMFGGLDGYIELRPKVEGVQKIAYRKFFPTLGKFLHALPHQIDYCRRKRLSCQYGMMPRDEAGNGKKENITTGQCVWAEYDAKDFISWQAMEKSVSDLKIAPSAIVQSGGGLHCYWWLEEEADALDIQSINKAICKDSDADKVWARTSLLRVPLSWHQKDAASPKQLQFIKLEAEAHSLKALRAAFGAQMALDDAIRPISHTPTPCTHEAVADLMCKFPKIRDYYHGIGCLPYSDQSGSGYDYAFARECLYHGATVADTCDALSDRIASSGRTKTIGYIHSTVGKADLHVAAYVAKKKKKILSFPQPKTMVQGQVPTADAAASDMELDLYPDDYYREALRGQPRKSLKNLITILQRDPLYEGKIRYNEFKNRYEIDDLPLSGHIITRIRLQIATGYGLEFVPTLAEEAVQYVAHEQSYHPVREYFEGCYRKYQRSPTNHLKNWLVKYCKADNTPLNKAIGKRMLISGVARIMRPGCEVHSSAVFLGPKGIGKSSTLKLLAGKTLTTDRGWFRDSFINLSKGRDAYSLLRGVLIYEFPEMRALQGQSSDTIKAFLSSPTDSYRSAYAHFDGDVPRQCIFGMTSNNTHDVCEAEGSRRLWTVEFKGKVKLEALSKIIDALWGEAVAAYKNNVQWHLIPSEEKALAKIQVQYQSQDTWIDALLMWDHQKEEYTLNEILRSALNIEEKWQNKSVQTRAARCLHVLGWTKSRADGVGRHHLWIPPVSQKGEK